MAGTPLLTRVVTQLAERGLRRFTIVDGYRGEMVRDALTTAFPAEWFHFVRNSEWDTTGNAYSLHLAGQSLKAEAAVTPADMGAPAAATGPATPSAPEPIFLLDSDIALDPRVLDRLLDAAAPNRLALRSQGGLGHEEMKVRLDAAGEIVDISKEILPEAAAGESVGLEIFSAPAAARLFDILAERVAAGPGRTEFYEVAFVELIRAGVALGPVDLGDLPCMEIDTADDLARANALFGVPA